MTEPNYQQLDAARYWRYEYAGRAMQGFLSCPDFGENLDARAVAAMSVAQADLLIEALETLGGVAERRRRTADTQTETRE